jgi:CheY-like chemotaxis protein
MGFRVLTAESGREAIAAAANNHIDLVLTDFSLPDMSGPTLIRRLRQLNGNWTHIPTVLLTAFDGYEYRNLAAEAGCDAYVVKPPNFETLLGIIDRLLQASQAKQRCY